MIRHGRFKYIHYVGYAPMLFDLESDPHERIDLAGDPARRSDLEACEAALRAILSPEAVDERARGRVVDLDGGERRGGIDRERIAGDVDGAQQRLARGQVQAAPRQPAAVAFDAVLLQNSRRGFRHCLVGGRRCGRGTQAASQQHKPAGMADTAGEDSGFQRITAHSSIIKGIAGPVTLIPVCRSCMLGS